ERLVGRAIKGRRREVILATKFGNVRDERGNFLGVNGGAEYVRQCCDGSLRRLGVDAIDLYYQHRVDPKVPIDKTVGAMSELVHAGNCQGLTCFLPLNTAFKASSALMRIFFLASCSPFLRMQDQSFFVNSVLGMGLSPTIWASFSSGWTGFMKAAWGVL